MAIEMASDLMTVAEAARTLRCSESAIRMWAAEGRLSGFRTFGGHLRLDRRIIEALAERRILGPNPKSA